MLKLFFVFTLFYISCSWCSVIPPVLPLVIKNPLADLTNNFGFRFYNQLKDAANLRDKNLFFSPLSIAIALGMTHLGARGNTAEEMETVFYWDPQTVNQDFKDLGQALQPNSNELVLRLANRIWGRKGMPILRSFVRDSRLYFDAGMALADFANYPEQARKEINKWVENKTENKIQDLLKPSDVDSSTIIVLVNAIYFKGTWKYQFDERKTIDSYFYLDYRMIPVKLMTENSEFKYLYDGTLSERCEVLELPYAGDEASMFFVLPENRGSRALRTLEQGISSTVVDIWVNSVRAMNITVYVPRFKVKHHFEATDFLKTLGIKNLFTGPADLSGITGSVGISVSKVVHEAFVEVNEKGTEAAAATAVIGRYNGGFIADHPFLYFIYHKPTRSILFMGRVMDPSQEDVK